MNKVLTLDFKTTVAGPYDPNSPLGLVLRGVRKAFRKSEKLNKKGFRKGAMTNKQKKSLAEKLQKATNDYNTRNAFLSLSNRNDNNDNNNPYDSDDSDSDSDDSDDSKSFPVSRTPGISNADYILSDIGIPSDIDILSDTDINTQSETDQDFDFPSHESGSSSAPPLSDASPPRKKTWLSVDGKISAIYWSQKNRSADLDSDFDQDIPRRHRTRSQTRSQSPEK